jgi:hypothetical protein
MEMIEVSTGNIVEFGTGKKSTEANIDAALAELVDGQARWADVPLSGRASLLKQVLALMTAHAGEWVATAAAIKGLDAKSPLMGEEWTSGPYPIVAACAALSATLEKLAIGQSPARPAGPTGLPPQTRIHRRALDHCVRRASRIALDRAPN